MDIEIYIVSSSQDVHSTAVYPTAPYTSSSPLKNITFLPDPCIVKLNGVTIAMTATDIYNHMLEAEIAVYAYKNIIYLISNSFYFLSTHKPTDV